MQQHVALLYVETDSSFLMNRGRDLRGLSFKFGFQLVQSIVRAAGRQHVNTSRRHLIPSSGPTILSASPGDFQANTDPKRALRKFALLLQRSAALSSLISMSLAREPEIWSWSYLHPGKHVWACRMTLRASIFFSSLADAPSLVTSGGTLMRANSGFDRAVIDCVCRARYGFDYHPG